MNENDEELIGRINQAINNPHRSEVATKALKAFAREFSPAKVSSLGKKRLELNPVVYTVVFTHDQRGLSLNVYDIQDSEKDRLAVADDLEAAAKSLREGV